ncbi:phage/plasmid replication protein, II/X family [Niveibacterium microcysteis]|uniref:Replication-associated protein G2P N-terminal domain-containing protein n=1 Tax=Niveibacterium microcysteis TaxID=2811415 RepID=A0ABX7MCA2_9RHOO|nr:phage/plasmid replication protein, II/X family [Niveibacterium microcysteis]QSI78783.1 hypothetical protein JY500_09330 [Niveibacterium microcysteis]
MINFERKATYHPNRTVVDEVHFSLPATIKTRTSTAVLYDENGSQRWFAQNYAVAPGKFVKKHRLCYRIIGGTKLQAHASIKVLHGHNIYGSDDLILTTRKLAKLLEEHIQNSIDPTWRLPSSRTCRINQVSIVRHVRLAMEADVSNAINEIALRTQAQKLFTYIYPDESVRFSTNERDYTITAYDKFIEYSKDKTSSKRYNQDKLLDATRGLLRFEIRVKYPTLKRLGLTMRSDWSPETADLVFSDLFAPFERILGLQPIVVGQEPELPISASPSLRRAVSYAAHGGLLRSVYSDASIRRLQKEASTLGINLSDIRNAIKERVCLSFSKEPWEVGVPKSVSHLSGCKLRK